MPDVAITGSAGGIGAPPAPGSRHDGARVIGVDVRDAEVDADLSTGEGRADMVAQVTASCGGGLDGVVAAAGITHDDGARVTAINYFGAVATLDGVAAAPRPSAPAPPPWRSAPTAPPPARHPLGLVEACLARRRGGGAGRRGPRAWAPTGPPSWRSPGGSVGTRPHRRVDRIGRPPERGARPASSQRPMTAGTEDFIFGLGDIYPIPAGRAGTAEEVAALLCFLLGAGGRVLLRVGHLHGRRHRRLSAARRLARSRLTGLGADLGCHLPSQSPFAGQAASRTCLSQGRRARRSAPPGAARQPRDAAGIVSSDTTTRTNQRARSRVSASATSSSAPPRKAAAIASTTSLAPASSEAVPALASPNHAARVGVERTPSSAAITVSTRRFPGSAREATRVATAAPRRRASRWTKATRSAWRSSK